MAGSGVGTGLHNQVLWTLKLATLVDLSHSLGSMPLWVKWDVPSTQDFKICAAHGTQSHSLSSLPEARVEQHLLNVDHVHSSLVETISSPWLLLGREQEVSNRHRKIVSREPCTQVCCSVGEPEHCQEALAFFFFFLNTIDSHELSKIHWSPLTFSRCD